MKPYDFLYSLSLTFILCQLHYAQSKHPPCCSSCQSSSPGARNCTNTNQKYSPCLKEHMVLKVIQSISGQNAGFLRWLHFLLLLTGLFVLVALYPSLPVGTLSFPLPGFLFLYFFLKMLPTFLTLCVLLLILPVLFGIDIPTTLRSGRKGVNQGHGLVWQETCPFLVMVYFLCFAFHRTNANWSWCTVRFRKEHQFENKYTQPYRVCFVFMSSWWKSRPSLGWLSSLAAERKSPWGVSHAFSEEPQTRRLWFSRTVILTEQNFLSVLVSCGLGPTRVCLAVKMLFVCVCFGLVSAYWNTVNWFIILIFFLNRPQNQMFSVILFTETEMQLTV